MAVNLNDPNNLSNQQQAGQPAGVQQQQQQFKPRTSGFTNIQRVLGANQNNKLGQTVNTGVQSIANKTQSQAQDAQNKFAQDIGSSVEDIKKGTGVNEGLSSLNFTNPDEASAKLSKLSNWSGNVKNLNQGYNGPQGLENQDQLQNNAQDLQQTGQNLLSAGGRQAALQRFVNAGPNYTQGKQRLDAMLLGQTGGQDLREARRGAQQTAGNVQDLVGQAQQQSQAIGQTYNTLGKTIQDNLVKTKDKFGNTLDERAVAQNKANADYTTGLQDRIKNKQLTEEDAAFLENQGILDKDGNLYNLDTSNGATNDLVKLFDANTGLTTSNTTTQSDLNSRRALASLSGLDPEKDADKIKDLDEAQVGQNLNQINKNEIGLGGYAAQKKAAEDAVKNFNFGNSNSVVANYLNNPSGSYSYQDATKFLDPAILEYIKNPSANPTAFNEAIQRMNNNNSIYGGVNTSEDTLDQGNYLRGRDDVIYGLGKQLVDTNKQYGIGNNISQLLANRNRPLNK